MTRTVALRASALFVVFTLFVMGVGTGSGGGLSPVALIGMLLAALTIGFAAFTPEPRRSLQPARIRRR